MDKDKAIAIVQKAFQEEVEDGFLLVPESQEVLGIEASKLSDEYTSVGADSLDLVQVSINIEDQLDDMLSFSNSDLAAVKTFGDIVNFLIANA